MTKIKTLKNWNEDHTKRVPIAPRTHTKAVLDNNGNTLDSLMAVQDEKLSELGSEVRFDIEKLRTNKVNIGSGKNILSLEIGADNNRLDSAGNLIPNTDCYVSTYIPCSEQTAYCFSSNDTEHPPLQLSQGIVFYDESFAIVGGTVGDGNNVVTFSTPKNSKYIRVTILRSSIDYDLQLEVGSLRTSYEPYSPIAAYHAKVLKGSVTNDKIADNSITTDKIADKSVNEQKLSIVDYIVSENLLNPNSWIAGQYYNADGSVKSAASMSSNLVTINGAGIYRFLVYVTWFGSSANLIPLFGDKGFLVKKMGTLLTPSSETSMIEVEITDSDILNGVKYIGCSYTNVSIQPQITTLMVVKGEYPTQYIPFRSGKKLNVQSMENRLVGKLAVFDGDSICAGIGSEDGDYGRGWAGRIQIYNDMNCHNEGISGAVVVTGYTGSISNRHSICGNIDSIYNKLPSLDYLILEGGTNDADAYMLGNVLKGTIEPNNFNPETFDTTTIAGAFDMLFYKALNYFPNAKIGYIVAQKMGTGNQRYRREIFDLAVQACEKWGIPYIDLWNGGQLRPEIPSMWDGVARTSEESKALGLAYYDGQHLTSIGYDMLSPKIDSWMKTL